MSLNVNGIEASSLTINIPWSGAWICEVTIVGDILPTGKVAITSDDGAVSLIGTVDDTLSGAFSERRHVRIVAGGNGWSKIPSLPQHFHSDAGLPLQSVASVTATAVGEVVQVITPTTLGPDYVRISNADDPTCNASQVFTGAGVDWWVGFDGITLAGIRPPVPQDPDLEIQDWDATNQVVTINAARMVQPGTVLIDQRWNGTPKIVQSCSLEMKSAAVVGTLRVSNDRPATGSHSESLDLIKKISMAATEDVYSHHYNYVVSGMVGDRVSVVPDIINGLTMPSISPISVWAGMSGMKANLTPGTKVLMGFIGGDKTKPYIAAFEPPENNSWRPAELDLDALLQLAIGTQCPSISLGGDATAGALPIALAPPIVTALTALSTALKGAGNTASLTGITPVTGATLGTALTGISTALDSAISAMGSDLPSKKVIAV